MVGWAAQLLLLLSSCPLHLQEGDSSGCFCDHSPGTSTLLWPAGTQAASSLCCWLCLCPFLQKGLMLGNCFQASLKDYPCKSRFDPLDGHINRWVVR